jgi:hypothetical protein
LLFETSPIACDPPPPPQQESRYWSVLHFKMCCCIVQQKFANFWVEYTASIFRVDDWVEQQEDL